MYSVHVIQMLRLMEQACINANEKGSDPALIQLRHAITELRMQIKETMKDG